MRLRLARLPRPRGVAPGLRLRAALGRQLGFVESVKRRGLRVAAQGHDLAIVRAAARARRRVVRHHQRIDVQRVAVGDRHFAAIDHQTHRNFREEPHGVALQRDALRAVHALPLRQHQCARPHRRQRAGQRCFGGMHAFQPVGFAAGKAAVELLIDRRQVVQREIEIARQAGKIFAQPALVVGAAGGALAFGVRKLLRRETGIRLFAASRYQRPFGVFDIGHPARLHLQPRQCREMAAAERIVVTGAAVGAIQRQRHGGERRGHVHADRTRPGAVPAPVADHPQPLVHRPALQAHMHRFDRFGRMRRTAEHDFGMRLGQHMVQRLSRRQLRQYARPLQIVHKEPLIAAPQREKTQRGDGQPVLPLETIGLMQHSQRERLDDLHRSQHQNNHGDLHHRPVEVDAGLGGFR